MEGNPKQLGNMGEEIALGYLCKAQYKIIEKNYRCRLGEIDIIAYKNHTYIFVEVKTRRNLNYGRPIEAINHKKRMHLLRVAQYYIQTTKLTNCDFRFDAIEVMVSPNVPVEISHVKNILLC